MKLKILTILFLFPTILLAQIFNKNFLFEDNNQMESCSYNRCIDIKEAVKLSKESSLVTKKDALRVYQAQQMIRAKLGRLFPSFSMKLALDPKELALEFIPNLLGFLFPSNWFRLKESILFSRAQEINYKVMLANQVNAAETLYFGIHKELHLRQLLTKHLKYSQEILKVLSLREGQGELPLEVLESFKVYNAELNLNELHIKKGISDLVSDLGFALNVKEDWNNFGIMPLSLPNLEEIKPLDFEDFYPEILSKSPEMVSLEYLKVAAEYSRKARAWTFLVPGSGVEDAFGVGYFANLNIGKAEVQLVEVEKEAFTNRLRDSLYKLTNQHNMALESYDESERGLGSLKIILSGMLDDFNVSGDLKADELEGILNKIFYFQLERSYAQHTYLISISNLKRLRFLGEDYQNLEGLIPSKKEGDKLTITQRIENRVIENLIKRGKLKLPPIAQTNLY